MSFRLALLGNPVAHSRSPAIHSAALAAAGLTGVYSPRQTDSQGVVAACGEIRSGVLDGANVTMPLKGAALAEADIATPVARRAGAVNTLSRRGGLVHGENTDVGGVTDAWVRRGVPVDDAVLILGGGGAAAAALLATEGFDAEIRIATRRRGAGADLVERLGVAAREQPWSEPVPGAVIVNATPLGMRGERLPDRLLDTASGLFDMAYGPAPTPAVEAMGDRPVADGIDLLVAQAARSFRIWTGEDVPIDVLEAAARR